MLHVTQKGNDAETTRVLRVVMDSYTQRRAEYEALIKAGTAPERLATLETDQSFTRSLSVTPSPVKPETHYYFALLNKYRRPSCRGMWYVRDCHLP